MNKQIAGFLISCLLVSAQAELWMPSIFNDGMMLQSGKPVPVWGEADAGTEVTVEFDGQKKSVVASANGKWQVNLDPLPASSEPRNLTISSNSNTPILQYSNIQIGEIWILAGQSNMGWTLGQSKGGTEAAAQADYPWLRVFKQWPNQGACDEPARDVKGGQWTFCSPQTAAGFSGVGFFFARELQKTLTPGTPIALIDTQMGGTYAECWIDFQTLEKTPSAKPFLDKAASEIKSDVFDDKGYWGPNNFRRPAGLFNGKVAPLQPFAARGVIWYQGEGNSQKWLASGYAETLTALITSWRDGFAQPDLPFFIVQLPRYGAGAGNDWPAVRAAQAQVAKEIPQVELSVTIDLGEQASIHPIDKEPVGERLALLARAKVYSHNVACSGPVFQSLEKDGNSLIVHFKFADGLALNGAGGFELCGADGKFVPARPDIVDGALKLSSPDVAEPFGARYAWFNWGEVSLFNGAGLPAAPFTTEK